MDTDQLNSLVYNLARSNRLRVAYRGVVTGDLWPPVLAEAGRWNYLVSNTTDSDAITAQGHWVCVLTSPSGNTIFFDPLGDPPQSRWLTRLRENTPGRCWYSTASVQSQVSLMCGVYCLLFGYQVIEEEYTYQQFIAQFHSVSELERQQNDAICLELASRRFNNLAGVLSCDAVVQHNIYDPANSHRLRRRRYYYRRVFRSGNSSRPYCFTTMHSSSGSARLPR